MQMDPRPTYENGVGLPPRHTSVPTHTQWLSPRRRNANSLQNAIRLLEEYTKENDLLREEYAQLKEQNAALTLANQTMKTQLALLRKSFVHETREI